MTCAARVRSVLSLVLILAAAALGAQQRDDATIVSHGLSPFGDLKYPPDFTHFDYVDPQAPKGGTLSHSGYSAIKTFDSFNAHIIKGEAPEGLGLTSSDGGWDVNYDRLMVRSADEPYAVYGLVAYEAEYPPDRSWVIFRMRPEARFHDGSPLTAEDVKFSIDILKAEGDPRLTVSLLDVDRVEVLGPHEIRFVFAEGATTRDLAIEVSQFPILSKAYWSEHDFTQSSLEKPLSSGPYRIGDYKQGSWVEYERVNDYWGRDLPVNRGRWNFDVIRYEFFRDPTAELEAFKSGEFHLHQESTAKNWVLEYDFPAARDGRVIKHEIPDGSPITAYGYYFNTGRTVFVDRRVRKALDLAFDYEWTNRNIFYDQYRRTTSYFGGTGMEAIGLPSEAELALLEPWRDRLPPEVFDDPYVPPVTDGSGTNRDNISKALALLQEAGWRVVDGVLVSETGEPFRFEYLNFYDSIFRITSPWFQSLKLLGIEASNRLVDPAQYERLQQGEAAGPGSRRVVEHHVRVHVLVARLEKRGGEGALELRFELGEGLDRARRRDRRRGRRRFG